MQSKILLCNDKELPLTVISHSFLLSGHGIEKLFVAGHPVDVSECSALKKWLGWPDVNYSNYPQFMAFLEKTFVCPGNPDRRFVELFARKTRALKNRHGNPSVVLDTFPVCVNSVQYSKTVRSSKCQLVTLEARRCLQCRAARSLLRTHLWKLHAALSRTATTERPFVSGKHCSINDKISFAADSSSVVRSASKRPLAPCIISATRGKPENFSCSTRSSSKVLLHQSVTHLASAKVVT